MYIYTFICICTWHLFKQQFPHRPGHPAGEGGRLRCGLRGPADHRASAGAVSTGGIHRGDGGDGWDVCGGFHGTPLVIIHLDGDFPGNKSRILGDPPFMETPHVDII